MNEKVDTFYNRLLIGIQERKINCAELSRMTGIAKSNLSHYTSGAWKPKQDNLYKIAQALNVNEAWLMGYDVDMQRITPELENKVTEKLKNKDLANLKLTDGEIDILLHKYKIVYGEYVLTKNDIKNILEMIHIMLKSKKSE